MWFIYVITTKSHSCTVRLPNSGKEFSAETGSAKQDNTKVGAKDYSDQQLW